MSTGDVTIVTEDTIINTIRYSHHTVVLVTYRTAVRAPSTWYAVLSGSVRYAPGSVEKLLLLWLD